MLDFKKLMLQTPEEKEAAQIERDQQNQEYLQRLKQLADERVGQVNALMLQLDRLTTWEQSFVKSLHDMAVTSDGLGNMGGRLGTLSDRQLNALKRIVSEHLSPLAAQIAQQAAPPGGEPNMPRQR